MVRRMMKIALGMLLLPFCLGFTWHFGSNVFSIPYKHDVPYYFLAGGLAYLALHFLFRKPILTYVFGHELTHAFFAVLFGGSIKSFQASERGGQVSVTKSNFVITLAPYFFPLYTFLVLVLYLLTGSAPARGTGSVLIFLAGATFCFHLVLTVVFLQADQKDIREQGAVFSYPLIYLFNVLFAALLVHLLLARENRFLDFLGNGIMESVRMTVLFLAKLYGLII
jgi:hypothetical protein